MIVTGRKKLDRVLVKKEFMENNGPKSSVWQAINVNGFSKGYKRMAKTWPTARTFFKLLTFLL